MDLFKINHFEDSHKLQGYDDYQFEKRKRSYYETFRVYDDDEEDLWPKAKHVATEEKVTDAFKNLNLERTIVKRDEGLKYNFKEHEDKLMLESHDENEEEMFSNGILLSKELKKTLKQSKNNSDYEFLKKLSSSTKEINPDTKRLQVVLWEPNKNMASKIINEISISNASCSSSNSSLNFDYDKKENKEALSSDQELSVDDESNDFEELKSKSNVGYYTVDEPVSELSPKRSLKRTYSELNKLSIEEINAENENNFNNDSNSYYFVDEPSNNNKNNSNNSLLKSNTKQSSNSLKISEVFENDSDSMEL